MAATHPEDLVLEYDMLQLVDGDESDTSHLYDVTASPVDSSDVEELFANCSDGASSTEATTCKISCASLACASAGASCRTTLALSSPEVETNTPNDFAAFLLDGEQFLRDMEKVVKIGLETQKYFTALEQSDGAIDLNAFSDLEIPASPCPRAPSSVGDSPHRNDRGDFGCEYQDSRNGHDPSCSTLPHSDSIFSIMSETSSLGHTTDGSVTTSPVPSIVNELGSTHENIATHEFKATHEEDMATREMMASYENMATLENMATDEADEVEMDEIMADELKLLEKEVKYLDAQKDYLQTRVTSSRRRRLSIKQRRPNEQSNRSVKSQEEKQLLLELVTQQQVYQDNFKAMLVFAPVNDVRLALMTPMESYIHLNANLHDRRQTILSLREEKLAMTYKFIEHKATGLDWTQPHQYSDVFEKFGKQYCVNFAISKYEGVSVFQVGRALYEQIAGNDEAMNRAMGSTTIRESIDTIKCNFMHQRIVSSMQWEDDKTEKMPDMESNAIFYCQFGDNSAILATDYIDRDELHPYDTSNRIRKDISSGVVLSSHVDDNGMKYVVMKRYLLAKYHMYPHKVTQQQQDRYFADIPKCQDTMKSLMIDRLQRNGDGMCGRED